MGVPVDGTGFVDSPVAQDPFGWLFDPSTAWPVLVVIGLALLVTGWLAGRMAQRPREDNADAIWTAIDKAARAALTADDAHLEGKADALKKTLDQKLGAVATVVGGKSDLRKALDSALEGKSHAQPAHDDPGHKDQDDHGDHHAEPAVAPTTQVIINTGGHEAAHGSGHGSGRGHAPSHLSPHERTRALRLAVSDLSQHWRQEAARKAELRAAHRELSAN